MYLGSPLFLLLLCLLSKTSKLRYQKAMGLASQERSTLESPTRTEMECALGDMLSCGKRNEAEIKCTGKNTWQERKRPSIGGKAQRDSAGGKTQGGYNTTVDLI